MIAHTFGRRVPFTIAPLGPAGPAWFDIWPAQSGAPWVRAQRTPDGYRIRYERRGDFLVDRAAFRIVCDPIDCPEPMMRHFVLDQVVPLMLSVDRIVLHASSVAAGRGFAAFVGPGGAGKSTLALALGRAGLAIGSDDGLLIESGLATPSYPSIRVWEDSAALAAHPACNPGAPPTAKRQYREGFVFATDPRPLTRLYVLDPEPSASVRFEPVAPRELAIGLVEQSYRLALDDRDALARQFDELVALARAVPAWRLSSPRRLDGWRELARAVIDHLGDAVVFEVA